jgi:hypothetical protein
MAQARENKEATKLMPEKSQSSKLCTEKNYVLMNEFENNINRSRTALDMSISIFFSNKILA